MRDRRSSCWRALGRQEFGSRKQPRYRERHERPKGRSPEQLNELKSEDKSKPGTRRHRIANTEQGCVSAKLLEYQEF